MSKENPYATRDPQGKYPDEVRVPEKPEDREHEEYEKYNNSNMDSARIRNLIKERVKLQKIAETVLDAKTLSKLDDMPDLEVKKEIIKARQKNANLDGKSAVYIQARFDALIEDMTPVHSQVIAKPVEFKSKLDQQPIDSDVARQVMIDKMKNSYQARR
jgi:hypothetical protein